MNNYKIYSDTIEQSALDQFHAAMVLPCVVQGALMPDSHKGYSLPIGAVVKTKGEVFPGFVGYDIGCGVACMEFGIKYNTVNLNKLKEHILNTIPIGVNRHKEAQDSSSLTFKGTSTMLQDAFSIKGKKQLGTLGGGNHFIEVGYLESNKNLVVVIHSGSRGLGHTVASHYMKEAASLSVGSEWPIKELDHIEDFYLRNILFKEKNSDGYYKALAKYITKQKAQFFKSQDIEGLHSLALNSESGKQYMLDQTFCLDYALLNRKQMIQKVYEGVVSQVPFTTAVGKGRFINRNHNHAELKDGHVIHRKGATHAEAGMLGVIPGNMRDGSFIVKGKGNPDSLCSSSHGAGRVLSRTQAKKQLSLEEFHEETAKLVTNHTDEMLDEAPKAYKDIFEVMELQSDLVEVLDRVIPILNIKG